MTTDALSEKGFNSIILIIVTPLMIHMVMFFRKRSRTLRMRRIQNSPYMPLEVWMAYTL